MGSLTDNLTIKGSFGGSDQQTAEMSKYSSRLSSYSSELEETERRFKAPGLPKFTTRSLEKKNAELSSSKYVLANQTGESPLHTAWYINEKGDKIWLKFDSSIPCNMFPTYETRFYKPKLHKMEKDPYAEKKTRGM